MKILETKSLTRRFGTLTAVDALNISDDTVSASHTWQSKNSFGRT